VGLSHDNMARLRALVADGTFTVRFSVEREIGHGGMGRVYEGVQRETGKRIAIKVLDPGLAGDPVRFQAEATILEQLDHPAIVRYVAHGLTGDGRAYLAMEWLEGETLAERLHRQPLSTAECVAVGQRVADALAYLHERDIVHRDIKPSNVFLVGRDPKAAMVIDLGIAKRLSVIGPTKTGEVIGTPGYMAPEQVRGESGIDERVDMFALGCLLYESLSGAAPFAGQVVMEVLARLLLAEPKPLDEVRPEIPLRLATLVAVLLAKSADDRTVDAEQAARELTTIANCLERNDTETLARSPWNRPRSLGEAPTVLARPPRKVRRWIVLAIAGVAIAAAVAIFLIVRRAPAQVKLVVTPDAEVPREPVVLPEDIDLARKPGPLVQGIVVDEPVSRELGTFISDSAWCAKTGRLVFVTLDSTHARVSSFERASQTITLVARLPLPEKGSGTQIVCLASGRVLLVTRDKGFTLDDTIASAPIHPEGVEFPSGIVDAAPVGNTARWLIAGDPTKPGALVEWNGEGAPRRLRDVCVSPRRLAPDGNRVACVSSSRLTIDDGKKLIAGPTASDVTWSADSSALYLNASPGLYRWRVGRKLERSFVAQGGPGRAIEVGPWLALVAASNHLTRQWIGRGAPRVLNPVEIGASFQVIAAIPEHGEVVLGLGSPIIAMRTTAIERDTTLLPPNRSTHFATINSIAFDASGSALATRATDRTVIVRTLAEREREGLPVPPIAGPPSGNQLTWRTDGTLALVGLSSLHLWDRKRRLQKVTLEGPGSAATVMGSDDLFAWTSDGIQELAIDGSRGGWLARTELLKQVNSVDLDRSRRYALLRGMNASVRVIDLGTARSVIEVDTSKQRLAHSGLIVLNDRPVLVGIDGKSQLFAIADGVATPLMKLSFVRSLAVSPAGPRIAIAAGREVTVYDLARKAEVLRGELTANVSAVAWSRDGRRLAAAADNTELVVFDVP
jgi:serine/threonine protein kinase